jgi:hypothetical protein
MLHLACAVQPNWMLTLKEAWMYVERYFPLRALAIAAAVVLGALELLALQRARVTRWRLAHKEY